MTPTGRVHTPQASLRLSGTWVLVTASPIHSQVAVLEGEVLLQSVGTVRSRRLTQGQMAQVQAGWLSVGEIPIEEWLARKGIVPPQAPPAGPQEPAPSPDSQPLTYEQQTGSAP